MIISKLTLQNIRLFKEKDLTFTPNTTIFLGTNASGKTTILEALFLMATGKSFRAEKDSELVSFEEQVGRVGGEIIQSTNQQINKSTNEKIELEIVLTKGEWMGVKAPVKKYSINDVNKRLLDFIGILKVVLFWPEDMELVTDSPARRRKYLDFVLLQVDREYRRSLISYEKGLRQRNRVLEAIRDRGAHRHQLLFWDSLLIQNGEYLSKKREEYIKYLNNFQFSIFNFQLTYDKSIISRIRLDQYSKEEVAAGVTLVGPHRDDFQFSIFNFQFSKTRELSHYGSRGEQRLAILWLKLGELSYIENQTGEKPVLLLDDILSELDHEHRKIIFEVINQQQTIMTMTDVHFIEKEKMQNTKVIEIS